MSQTNLTSFDLKDALVLGVIAATLLLLTTVDVVVSA
jgi:Ca2+-binding RTX toxin-like protein